MDAQALGWLALSSLALGAFMMAWYTSLKYLPVLKAASILALGGVVTALLEASFLGRAITLGEASGLFLILIGAASAAWLAFNSCRLVRTPRESGS